MLIMDILIHFGILYKALTGWIDILLPSNVIILFTLLHKSCSGWISQIRQIACSSMCDNQMTMECRQFEYEIIRLRAQICEIEVLNESLRNEKVLWLAERVHLITDKHQNELESTLRNEREMTEKAHTTDEINKLVEKLEKEKSRMKTSYAYFNGLSEAHKQKENEWNAEKTKMSIELITDRTHYELELKHQQDYYQSMIKQKDDKHKAQIVRMRQEFAKKMKKN